MSELVFLLEEPSMKAFLDILLPTILPAGTVFKTIPHNGKTDLKKSIPKKLKAWNGDVKFVILHDKDSNDCINLKNELVGLCKEAGRSDTLVRIVCTELEAWYLGDLGAVEKAYNKNNIKRLQNNSKFRQPDCLGNPKEELKKLVKEYQQISGARLIADQMHLEENNSHSFQVFIEGVRRLAT